MKPATTLAMLLATLGWVTALAVIYEKDGLVDRLSVECQAQPGPQAAPAQPRPLTRRT